MEKKNDKAKIMASLLRNKTVAKAFNEAMSAPMGSTKRQKAQKLVSILRKTVTKFDGKGGPGMGMYSASGAGTYYAQPTMPQASAEMGGMVIFNAPPSPFDGKGGPGFEQLSNPFNLGGPMPTSLSGLGNPSANPWLQGIGQNSGKSPWLTGLPQNRTPQTSGISLMNPGQLTLGNPFGNVSVDPRASGPARPQPQQQLAAAPAPQGEAAPAADGTLPTMDEGGSYVPPAPGAAPEVSTDTTPRPGSYAGLSALTEKAIGSNMGPSTFAYGAMNDINVLRELMPGVPDADLPVGASLTGQILKIKEALKKEHNIEGLTNRLNEKLRTGSTLDEDLKDYIRGKDEYLNEVDGMLSDAKRTYIERAGGPDAGIMANYVDYLTTLKGRQNKRYIEFYNGAIQAYNGELQALQSQLQTATAAYTEELSDQSALKQDDYNRIFSALTELYNTTADAPRKQIELQLLQEQLVDAITQNATGGVTGAGWISEFGNLKNQGVLIDKDSGTLLSSITSLEPALETILSNRETDLGGALRILGEAISNDLGNAGDDVNGYLNKVKKYENMLIDLKNASLDPMIQAKYGADFSPAVDTLAQNLAGASGEAISSYVLNNAEKVKDAMKPLVKGQGLFGLGGTPSRESYLKHFPKNTGMSEDVLARLYDYYSAIQSADPRGTTMKNIYNLPADQFANEVSRGLGHSLFGGVSAVGT